MQISLPSTGKTHNSTSKPCAPVAPSHPTSSATLAVHRTTKANKLVLSVILSLRSTGPYAVVLRAIHIPPCTPDCVYNTTLAGFIPS